MRQLLPSVSGFQTLLRRLRVERDGVTSLEYALIAAVMVTAIASTIRGVSAPVTQAFQNMYNAFF